MKLDINLENETLTPQVGYTAASGDGVASAIGLLNTGAGELIFFPNSGVFGLTLNLFNLLVDIVVLGDDRSITQGDLLFPSGNPLQIPLTFSTIGTVTGGTGANVAVSKTDEYSDDLNTALYEITTKAPGIVCRQPVLETLQTGILAVDSIIPIGRGQRELIIGDRQTGKTTVAVDTIINQSNFPADKEQVYCVYTAIAQKRSNVRYLFERFRLSGAIFFTTIVSATSSEAASLHFLAPYTACAVGEFFKSHGLSSLVIYDDLTKHAMAYRQMSLLLRRSPGREAYPGDVFYIHSRLLERSAKMNFVYGNGSLTALPVIETQAGDVSAYIPTNVISITDGQIFLESQLFNKGIRPAINVGLSVSRIGSAAQLVGIKNVSSSIKLELAQFREVESFAFLGSELDDTTKATLNRGIRIVELLKQDKFSPLSPVSEIVLLFGGMRGYLDLLDISGVRLFKQILVKAVELIPTLSAEILVAQALVRYDLFIHLVTSNVVKVLLDPENKKENVGSGRSFDLPLVWQFEFQDSASSQMEGIVDLYSDVMAILVSILVFVFIMLAKSIKESLDNSQYISDATPILQWNHHTPLEFIWTVIPSLILVLIAIPSFSLLFALEDDLDVFLWVKVIGSQWFWSYEFSKETPLNFGNINLDDELTLSFDSVSSYAESQEDLFEGELRLLEVDNWLIIPNNISVKFLITSNDVLHSWAIPSLGIKMDACPGRLNVVTIFTKRPGIFYGQCSEICGINHAFMPIVLEISHTWKTL